MYNQTGKRAVYKSLAIIAAVLVVNLACLVLLFWLDTVGENIIIIIMVSLIFLESIAFAVLSIKSHAENAKRIHLLQEMLLSNKANFDEYENLTDKDLPEMINSLLKKEYKALIMKKQAEIDALQSQINPHFLYNTLETIRGQALICGAEDIAEMTKALADIFRHSISKRGAMISLSEELKNIDSYIKIQQIRFNNKFTLEKEIDEDTKDIKIPKLLIQPLVENALLHGLETKKGQGHVHILAYRTNSKLIISVKDDGMGMSIDRMKQLNERFSLNDYWMQQNINGVGLENINARIKLVFGDDFGVSIISTQNVGTTVTLTMGIINYPEKLDSREHFYMNHENPDIQNNSKIV